MLLSLSKLIGSAISVLIFRTDDALGLFGELAEVRRWEFVDADWEGSTSDVSPIATGLGVVEERRSLLLLDPSHFCTFLLFLLFWSLLPPSQFCTLPSSASSSSSSSSSSSDEEVWVLCSCTSSPSP